MGKFDMSAFEALVEGGATLTFRVPKAEWTRQIAIRDLPLGTILKCLEYGAMRLINDRVGGESMTGDKLAEALATLETRIHEGDWADASERLSPMDRAVRDVLTAALKATGLKAADAAKDAKEVDTAVATLAQRRFAAGKHDSLEAAVDYIAATVEAKAREMVAAKGKADDLI